MTKDEWARIAALIDGLWKDEFDKTRQASFFMVLAPFDAIDVYAAVIECTDEDRPFGAVDRRAQVAAAGERQPVTGAVVRVGDASLEEVAQRCRRQGREPGAPLARARAPVPRRVREADRVGVTSTTAATRQ
jgi:hypothetical protein